MEDTFFAYISRMRYITRWSLMRNSYEENVQEHSHMAAVLAHALAVIRNRYFGGSVDVGEVVLSALYHDATEILTGDLPTPIKYYSPAIRDSYKAVESVAREKLLQMLPPDLAQDFAPVIHEPSGDVGQIVKAADKLSAYIKCVEEEKAGNSEFRAAAEQIYDALKAMKMPETDYFMAHFLPAFSRTLDELNETNRE